MSDERGLLDEVREARMALVAAQRRYAEALRAAREDGGLSFDRIGAAAGVTKQSAREHYLRGAK